jgi:hypothetical protein
MMSGLLLLLLLLLVVVVVVKLLWSFMCTIFHFRSELSHTKINFDFRVCRPGEKCEFKCEESIFLNRKK